MGQMGESPYGGGGQLTSGTYNPEGGMYAQNAMQGNQPHGINRLDLDGGAKQYREESSRG